LLIEAGGAKRGRYVYFKEISDDLFLLKITKKISSKSENSGGGGWLI